MEERDLERTSQGNHPPSPMILTRVVGTSVTAGTIGHHSIFDVRRATLLLEHALARFHVDARRADTQSVIAGLTGTETGFERSENQYATHRVAYGIPEWGGHGECDTTVVGGGQGLLDAGRLVGAHIGQGHAIRTVAIRYVHALVRDQGACELSSRITVRHRARNKVGGAVTSARRSRRDPYAARRRALTTGRATTTTTTTLRWRLRMSHHSSVHGSKNRGGEFHFRKIDRLDQARE